MADQKQQNPRSERRTAEPAREHAEMTHVLGRARNARGFNRAGFRWHQEYQAISLKEIAAKADAMNEANATGKPTSVEQLVKTIINEPALDARLVTADEAQEYESRRQQVIAEEISPTQLYQAYVAQSTRIAELERKLEEVLGEKYGLGGDKPPKQGELPTGSMPVHRG